MQLDAAAALDARSAGRDAEPRRRPRAQVNELSKQVGRLRRDGRRRRGRSGCRPRAGRSATTERRAGRPSATVGRGDLRELLLRIPNLPHPDAPDGACDADNPVVKGPVGLPDAFPEHQPGAALGDRRRARHPRQRAGGQDQRGDVHDAARPRRHAGAGPVPARPRPQRRRASRRSARRRSSRRRRSPPPASCRSSPTTPTPSSATTCGASPRPRCR